MSYIKKQERARRKALSADYKRQTASPPLPPGLLLAILKEVYGTHFEDDKQGCLYGMLSRYESKLSPRLKAEKVRLYEIGVNGRKDLFRSFLLTPNPFLTLLPKSGEYENKP